MTEKNKVHERIRFRKSEHRALHRMPSAAPAAGAHALHGWARFIHATSRVIAWSFAVVFAFLVVASAYLYFFGLQNAQLSSAVRSAVQSIAGETIRTDLKDSRLSIDSSGNLALEATELVLARQDGTQIATVDRALLGLKIAGLIAGKLEIDEIEVGTAKVTGGGNGFVLPAQILNAEGRIDPGKIAVGISNGALNLNAMLRGRGLERIRIDELAFPANAKSGIAGVKNLALTNEQGNAYLLSGTVDFASKTLPIKGRLGGSSFEVRVEGFRFGEQVAYDPELNDGTNVQLVPFHGNANVVISGNKAGNQPGTVRLKIDIPEFDFQNFRRVRLAGNAEVTTELREGVDTLEILDSRLNSGDNRIDFSGALGPLPADAGDGEADYRFELISNNAVLMPEESSEAAVKAAGRISGTFDTARREFNFSNIDIRTNGGEVVGKGEVILDEGSPEMLFALSIPRMKISDAKHLWPAMFASGARRWVLDHVFGGQLANSKIDISFGQGALWPKKDPTKAILPSPDQISARFEIEGARFDTLGELPPVRNSKAVVEVAGANTVITLSEGTAFLGDGSSVAVNNGVLTIPVKADQPVIASLDVTVEGYAPSIAEVANRHPLNALEKAPVSPADLSGSAVAAIKASFPLLATDTSVKRVWSAKVDFTNLTINKDFSGQKLSEASGTLDANADEAVFTAEGKLNGVPASIELREPLNGRKNQRSVSAKLQLDDAARAKLAPGLSDILKGPVELSLLNADSGGQLFEAKLDRATLSLPWAGWSKGSGVAATAKFSLITGDNSTRIENLSIKGSSFLMEGSAVLQNRAFVSADFTSVSLNKGDNFRVKVDRAKAGYDVAVSGKSIDLRALLKRMSGSFEQAAKATGGAPISLSADLESATGFNGEQLFGIIARYYGVGSDVRSFAANAKSASGGSVSIENAVKDGGRSVTIQTSDGGAVLRFMDIYDKMNGGDVSVELRQSDSGVLTGTADARNFTVTGEQKLKALVGAPVGPDGKRLEGARENLDVSTVRFERGTTDIQKGKGYLKLKDGILRSAQFGLSYSGTLYDQKGRIDLNGTFLPIYGLNRIFGELPIFGEILGNGRDNALLGITFNLQGDAKEPNLSINPISIIAPGIFRKIFEFQ